MNQMLNVVEFSQMFRISLSTAYQLVNSKGFPAIRVGRRIVIPYDKLMHWVDENLGINNERCL